MDKQTIIQKLKDLKPHLVEKYGVTDIALFGSYSRDEQTEKSDIDIMFDYEGVIGMNFFTVIREVESLFNEKVQVVSKKGIKEKYFNAIEPDLIYA